MEVSGTVLQRITNIYGAGIDNLSSPRRLASGGSVDVGGDGSRFNGRVRGIRVSVRAIGITRRRRPGAVFRDKQQGSAVLTAKKDETAQGMSKGLLMASELGFYLDTEKLNLLGEVPGKLTSDAAEVLLKQLEQLKAEKKEMKRVKKQEKAKLKAARMKTAPDCESSSSSSSESSDSDRGEMVDMRSLRASTALASATVDQLQSPVQEAAVLSPPSSLPQGRTTNENPFELGAYSSDTSISSINVGSKFDNVATTTAPQKRIEVCMGNKCKKSGAPALLQEFERVVGTEGAVVGCKCMGKCKTGPNVRVQNSVGEGLTEGLNNDSVKIPANPLFIGVSLEDVDAIVASLFGDNQSDPSSDAAAAP
ncbi:diacylglycerol O-acyltransferase 3-like [Neltuma alba]|uniref:diacylglycerol O-acyltransferase 3-like n=1 Tax=Neltuma alba TaxID=207710 RepID=UPI0010A58FFD|nr:diacylglycerol O-acyltransferase 3-like [Prosopis alba]